MPLKHYVYLSSLIFVELIGMRTNPVPISKSTQTIPSQDESHTVFKTSPRSTLKGETLKNQQNPTETIIIPKISNPFDLKSFRDEKPIDVINR